MVGSRTESLQRLQCLVELHEFLQFITDTGEYAVDLLSLLILPSDMSTHQSSGESVLQRSD